MTQLPIKMPLRTRVSPAPKKKKYAILLDWKCLKQDILCENGQGAPFLDISIKEGDREGRLGGSLG